MGKIIIVIYGEIIFFNFETYFVALYITGYKMSHI